MPRHLELKKDATNGETRRGVVRTQRSVDIRMGKPGSSNELSPMSEYIAHEGYERFYFGSGDLASGGHLHSGAGACSRERAA